MLQDPHVVFHNTQFFLQNFHMATGPLSHDYRTCFMLQDSRTYIFLQVSHTCLRIPSLITGHEIVAEDMFLITQNYGVA